MSAPSGLSFDGLRPWDGTVSRAFEELSYQLLQDQVPPGVRAVRTGNPDGGVEWFATFGDGTEWGWQAKHVHGIDALLSAMEDSLRRVCKERTSLRRLTFVISSNLNTGTAAGKQKSQRQKYEDRVASWKQNIPGASVVEIDLVQESDLLALLALPQHRGRVWFWWDQVTFDLDWLRQHYEMQSAAATQKYRPDLQVDIPIQDEIVALGYGDDVTLLFKQHRDKLLHAIVEYRFTFAADDPGASLYADVQDALMRLDASLRSAADHDARSIAVQCSEIDGLLERCAGAFSDARAFERSLDAPADNDASSGSRGPDRVRGYTARALTDAADSLQSWMHSVVGRSLQSNAYLLLGEAGSGKTHLLLDATRRALEEGRPAVFLAGAQFGRGDLWASLADQLGVQSIGQQQLLQAMNSAGQAASLRGNRFTIFIDALNETHDSAYWLTYLPTLRAALKPYPFIALVISCRSTYRTLILDDAEVEHYVSRHHPGFQDREIEATHKYFTHYGLVAPRIPLLTPEFTLPLFLRLYCESLAHHAGTLAPVGHQGRVSIFERYLANKVDRVARRLNPAAGSPYELEQTRARVTAVLEALLDELSLTELEGMSVESANGLATSAVLTPADGPRVIGLLHDEGVLTRERLWLREGETVEGVRIVFQAFSDFLLLRRRLATAESPLEDEETIHWLRYECGWGILEAACVLLPEVYGVEYADAVGFDTGPLADETDDGTDWQQRARDDAIRRATLKTLPYRAGPSVTERTIALMSSMSASLDVTDLYRVIITIAPQVDNLLNGARLHRHLTRMSMPIRDKQFGIAMYAELTDDYSPASRLARWAAAGPYPDYDDDVVELACIPLCWLLSSPHRPMRDWVTKALTHLLSGHLSVAERLFLRFWEVDDPYVVQRVVVIAYGALLRSAPDQQTAASSLVKTLVKNVFTRPMRPDELLLDAARGVVRWGESRSMLTKAMVAATQRPYGFAKPGPALSEETLERRYPWNTGDDPQNSYGSIHMSVLGYGDFGHYVIEPAVRYFSRYPVNAPYPPEQSREPRLVKRRWDMFWQSLSQEQQDAVSRATELQAFAALGSYIGERTHPELTFTDEQWRLLRDVYVYPKIRQDDYPAAAARRWVFRRTIGIGWTPQLFGSFDRRRAHGHAREGNKPERFGKKYQWMAYHELLARVADNFHWRRHPYPPYEYDGLHQMINDREIDPTLPPVPYRSFLDDDHEAESWGTGPIALRQAATTLDFRPYRGNIALFIADGSSEPSLDSLLHFRDTTGDRWVVLDCHYAYNDPDQPSSWRGLRQVMWVDTLLVATEQAEDLLTVASEPASRQRLRDFVDDRGHIDCCYFGEVGRVAPTCVHRHDQLVEATIDDRHFQVGWPLEGYTWEGGTYDSSMIASAQAKMPSALLLSQASLTLDVGGPSWRDETGAVQVMHTPVPGGDGQATLVRERFLAKFLAQSGLSLLAFAGFERMKLGNDRGSHPQPYLQSSLSGYIDHELQLHVAKASVREEFSGEARD